MIFHMRGRMSLLFCDHATSNAIARVSGGVGFHVVSFGVNHQRSSTVAENGVVVIPPIHVFVDDLRFRSAVCVHGEIWHIPGVMALGIFQSMLFVVRIEMCTGGFEVRWITLRILVDMDGMLAWRQIVQVELDHHPVGLVHER